MNSTKQKEGNLQKSSSLLLLRRAPRKLHTFFFFVFSWKDLGGSKDRRKHALNMISVTWKFRSGSALNRCLKRLFSFLPWRNFFHYGNDNFILYAPVYLTAWGCFEDTWHFWGQLLQFKFSVLQLQQLFWSFGWRKKWHLEISVRIWNEQEKKCRFSCRFLWANWAKDLEKDVGRDYFSI